MKFTKKVILNLLEESRHYANGSILDKEDASKRIYEFFKYNYNILVVDSKTSKREHWEAFIDTFHQFYLEKSGEEYMYNMQDMASFKKIYDFFVRRATRKGFELTEYNITMAFRFFLNKAWEREWMRQHFNVSNMLSQFNSIVNEARIGKIGKKQPTGNQVNISGVLEKINSIPG